MLKKNYICNICKTKPDQLSHHKMHLETQKHKDKKELFKFKLLKLTNEELYNIYNTTDINIIIDEYETSIYKKLNNVNIDDIDNINIIMTDKVNKSNNITNKEALKDKIHEIHNYLRNHGAGYGMNALKVFNLLYGLKKIEENNLIDKLNLKRPDCEFSYLVKLANENKENDEKITDLILNSILTSIYRSDINNLLFYEIPPNIKGSTFIHLIKEINNITIIEKTCNVQLSGKIYEYFLGRTYSTISELGAYFTDRHIVNYIYDKLDPKINDDGSINTMIDMFGGSGGFTTGYINFLNNKYNNIRWKENINKIYHFDINDDVIKSAGLEFLCLTNVLPNMNENLQFKNAFTDEFENKKFKYIITNPPYGGDKINKRDSQIKRDKIKEYIKNELKTLEDDKKIKIRNRQLKKIEELDKLEKIELEKQKVTINTCSQRIIKYAKDNNLKGNDKEAASLILIMDLLEQNGTAIGVLKEGVFFNKIYKDIRKNLIENFNVREVISIPQDQFENTSTKTSIIIFDNTEEKTSNVIFSELVIEKYDEDIFEEINDEIVLIENKGDISNVYDKYISEASKDELLKNKNYSLNSKEYNKKELKINEEYKLVKLGDICQFLPKSKRNASYGKEKGKYNFYTSSDKIQKCDETDYNEECIIIGDGGIANIKIDINFSCSDHNYILKSEYNKYIYYLLSGNINLLINGFKGSTLKNISKEYLVNLELPIPKNNDKLEEYINKISKPYNKKNKKEKQLIDLELEIQNKIKYIIENEDCEDVELGNILKREKNGKTNSTEITNTGEYNFYAATANNPIGTNNTYDFDGDNYLLFAKSGGNSKTIFGESLGIGKFWLVSGKTAGNIAMIKFTVNKLYNINYINKYLKYILYDIQKFALYTTGNGNINIDEMLKYFKIKIPKNNKIIDDLELLFNKVELLNNEIKKNDILYKQYIDELNNDIFKK